MIGLLKNVNEAWKAIPLDVKSFVISVAANAAMALFGNRSGGEQKRLFEKAYLVGLKGLTVTLEQDQRGLVEPYLGHPKVRGLLLKILENRSIRNPAPQITELASELGIDPTGDSGEKFNGAVKTFQNCFETQALKDADPLQWLIYLKIQSYFCEDYSYEPTLDLSKLKKAYLIHLCDDFERITFKGYTKGKAISIPLTEIFTIPLFDLEEDLSKSLTREYQEKRDAFKVPAVHVQKHMINTLLQCRLAVVTGGPGAGKSTLLKYLSLVLAVRQLENKDPDILPIIFPISAYAEKHRKAGSSPYTIKAFLSDYWKERYLDDPVALFESYWRKGRAVFLIDGLDEVADEGERLKMISDIRHFIMATMNGRQSLNRYYITCRSASYEGASQFEQIKHCYFRRFEIKRFDIDQIGHFLFSWYCWYERDFKNRKETYLEIARDKRDEIVGVIKRRENIYDLATNPLMLTILALLDHEGGQLPHSRAGLYSECLRILSGAWENLRSLWKKEKVEYLLANRKITDNMVVDFLGPVAFGMQDAAEKEVDETDLIKELAKSFSRRQPDKAIARDLAHEFIAIMRERSGLLDLVKPKSFGFLHQTFREYLAARWLAVFADYRSQLGDRLLKTEWREVVLLMAASFSIKEASRFIKHLADADYSRFAHLRLAGECLLDMGRDKIFDSTFYDLMALMWDEAINATIAYEKVILAEIIGRLDDSRADLEDFVPIEGGQYDLENIGEVEMARFEIGRYPVTNQWFSRFIKEGGYQNQSFWSVDGWHYLQTNQITIQAYGKDTINIPTAPVVRISWYEAAAFCQWLSEKDVGYRYFIPSQEQWQAAAAGMDKRKYPWGRELIQGVCYSDEIEIGRPSPVGIFAKGRTPHTHIYDMGGNVLEWTASNHIPEKLPADYPNIQDCGTPYPSDNIISKGGAWHNSAEHTACAYINISKPGIRLKFIGFRCARTKK